MRYISCHLKYEVSVLTEAYLLAPKLWVNTCPLLTAEHLAKVCWATWRWHIQVLLWWPFLAMRTDPFHPTLHNRIWINTTKMQPIMCIPTHYYYFNTYFNYSKHIKKSIFELKAQRCFSWYVFQGYKIIFYGYHKIMECIKFSWVALPWWMWELVHTSACCPLVTAGMGVRWPLWLAWDFLKEEEEQDEMCAHPLCFSCKFADCKFAENDAKFCYFC